MASCAAGELCVRDGSPPPTNTDFKCFNCNVRAHEDCKMEYDALEVEGYFIPNDKLTTTGRARLEESISIDLKICFLCVQNCSSSVELTDTQIEQKLDAFTLNYVSAVVNGDAEWYGPYNISNVRATKVLLYLRGLRFANPPKYRTIRDVFYAHRIYFTNYKQCYRFLRHLASKIGLSLCHLNVISDGGKGKIAASQGLRLCFTVGGGEPETRIFTPRSAAGMASHNIGNEFLLRHHKVPVDGEQVKIEAVGRGDGQRWKPHRIVLWEKKEWMVDSVKDGVLAKVPLIYICSEGRPSHKTHACVKFFHETYPDVDIVAGGDPGPFGVQIIASYFWTQSMKFGYSVPVKWGFLLPEDIYEDDETESSVQGSRKPLTAQDRKAHNTLMSHPWIRAESERRKRCQAILEKGEKHEMNNYKPSGGRTLGDFILARLKDGVYY